VRRLPSACVPLNSAVPSKAQRLPQHLVRRQDPITYCCEMSVSSRRKENDRSKKLHAIVFDIVVRESIIDVLTRRDVQCGPIAQT
jgi:hypothetical protein